MKRILLLILTITLLNHFMGNSNDATTITDTIDRLRVIMSSDFPPVDVCNGNGCTCEASRCSDPDDVQSMVRFLLYANEFDIEALIASSATFANYADKQHILDMLDLYDQIDENLRKYDSLYPMTDSLRAVTFQGRTGTWGKSISYNIGEGKDSEASNAIINIVDKPDPRPVYIGVWGDCSNIAQAIWKVQNTRNEAELQTFLSKIRIHQIAHQDETIDWLLDNFPDLFIIYSANTYQGMFGSSDTLSDLAWIDENIRFNHGPLGAAYPESGWSGTGVIEGDSPSFLWLVSANRGLNDPEDPTQPSWGGQFIRDDTTSHYLDGVGGSSISMWRADYQAEFALRADWMVSDTSYTLTSSITGMGSITPVDGLYNKGAAFNVTAIPAAGYQFDGWGGDLSGRINPVQLTMDTNKIITATFSEISQPSSTKIWEKEDDKPVELLSPTGNPYGESAWVNSSLEIIFSKELTEPANICLYDIQGKILMSENVKGFSYTLDMPDLPDGLYILNISGSNLNKVIRLFNYSD